MSFEKLRDDTPPAAPNQTWLRRYDHMRLGVCTWTLDLVLVAHITLLYVAGWSSTG